MEDDDEPGDRQQILVALAHMQQLQPSRGLGERVVARHHLAKTPAIDVGDVGEVQDHGGPFLQDETVDLVLEPIGICVNRDRAAEIEDGDAANLSLDHVHVVIEAPGS